MIKLSHDFKGGFIENSMPFDILALNLCSEPSENDRGDFIDKKIDIFDLNYPKYTILCLRK